MKLRRYSKSLISVALAIGVISIAGCSTSDNSAENAKCTSDNPQKVKVGFGIGTPDAAGAEIYAPKALGFYEEQGLDVEIIPIDGSVDASRQLASGNVDFAAGMTLEPIPQLDAKGESLQVILQYADKPIFSLAVPEGSTVTGPQDLKGRKIGVVSAGSGAVSLLNYLLDENKINKNEVDVVPIGLGPQAISAIKQQRIDALMFWDTAYVDFERAGIKFKYFRSDELEKGYASMGIVYNASNEDEFHCDNVPGRFARAVAQGVTYVKADPNAGVNAMGKVAPIVLENKENSIAKLRARAEIYSLKESPEGYKGWSSEQDWSRLQEVLKASEQLKTKVEYSKLFTNQFLQYASDFDKHKIMEESNDS